SSFVLENGKIFPHLSLYIARFEPEHASTVEAALQQIACNIPIIHAQAAGYTFAHKYVVADYQIAPLMVEAQKAVVNAPNPLRVGMPSSEQENMREATNPQVINNFEKYGYKYIGDFFRPHITLTRFEEEHNESELGLPPITSFDGNFMSIGLFELGPYSTCVRKLAEFPLLAVS